MRFAFVIFKYFPYGGIQRDLMKFVKECQQRGHEVKVFCLRWEAPEVPDLEVEIVPIVGLMRHAQYEHFADVVRAKLREENFDLVVGFNKIPGLDVYYAGDSCFAEKAQRQRSALYKLLPRYRSFYRSEKSVFDKTSNTEVLTLSDIETPFYRQHYGTDLARFHALPPGIERDRIAPADKSQVRAEFRREFGLGDDDLVLLSVGSGFIKKGLDRTLLAVKSLPAEVADRVHLFVIGRDKSDAFQRMAVRLGLGDKVTFFTDGRDDVPRFLFSSDALVHPAYDEAAGMVIVEAMLAGLPALVTRNCGYAKYLAEQEAGIVLDIPYSQDTMNAELLRLLTSTERERWIANGLAASERDDLFQMVTKAVDYLEEFARDRRDLIVFALFRYFPFGGMQRDFRRIARACVEKGYRVLVYCLKWEGDVPDGVEIITFETSAVTNHQRHEKFAELMQEDLSWRSPACVVGFNKMPGLDVYYAADSCYEHKAQQMRTPLYRTTRRYQHLARFERAVFGGDSDTKVMLVARNQQAQYQSYYDTDDARFFLLPPGVVADRKRGEHWREERRRVREEFGVSEEETLLITIGSGFITKGIDRVLEAFGSLDAANTRLVIIGEGGRSQFERLAKQLGVDARVTFLRGRDDIPAVLQAADLMIHPAYMESGGMVLIEAIIAGLPVIASGVCGFAHYIEDAEAGRVMPEPFDQDAFNETVAAAVADADLRAQWSANGVSFGLAHDEIYNMPKHALQFIEECIDDVRA